jgi:hypothetical protein
MSTATPIYQVGAVVLGYVGFTASWRRYAPGQEKKHVDGCLLCIHQVGSTDEGVYEPAQSITLNNRTAMIALREAIDEALKEGGAP